MTERYQVNGRARREGEPIRPPGVPSRLRLGFFVAGLCSVGLIPAGAKADTCAVLGAGRAPAEPAPPQSERVALDAVARALLAEGHTVIDPEDVAQRLVGSGVQSCTDRECAPLVVRSLHVDFAVIVTVWGNGGDPSNVVVTIFGVDRSASAQAPVGDIALADAALSAVTRARQRWVASHTGYLIIDSQPQGAHVEVDARPVGQTPLRHLVEAGIRTVRFHRDGEAPVERTVRVRAQDEARVSVSLHGSLTQPSRPQEEENAFSQPDPANFGLAVAFGLAGLLVATLPIATAALDGQCAEHLSGPDSFCFREYRFGTVSGVLVGVSATLLSVGIVFAAAQPLRVGVRGDANSAHLTVWSQF